MALIGKLELFSMLEPVLLPVAAITPELLSTLRQQDCILSAPPGAGKSTWLPLQLLQSAQFQRQKIIMLQPRRVAVRAIAHYLAKQLGEEVGNTVGYRIRGESRIGNNTRLEIVTEGLLTRKLQQNPELSDVGLVIFDEFHERSIHADFALALCCEVQQALREELRVLVMSATLDVGPLKQLLPQAKTLATEGRSYPLDYQYQARNTQQKLAPQLYSLVLKGLSENSGSMLVFLPGKKEIEQLQGLLVEKLDPGIQVFALYGDLSRQQQDNAIQPVAEGQRKVVLATNIAETSLTIEGISLVIDSGLENNASFQLRSGITQIRQQQISQASATQRAGRAARLGAGRCYRLWSQEIQQRLMAQSSPEILTSDVSPLVLEAKVWGTEVNELSLLDQPSAAQIQQASELLQELEALDEKNKVTAHGQVIAGFGTHPRLANMLIKARDLGQEALSLACVLAVLLEGRNLVPGNDNSDLGVKLQYLRNNPKHWAWQQIKQWHKRMQLSVSSSWPLELGGVLMAYAYPDRIAKLRSQGRYQLVNGSGACLSDADSLQSQPWLVAGQLISLDRVADAKITLASELNLQLIEQYFPHLFTQQASCVWQQQQIVAKQEYNLGKILLRSEKLHRPDAEKRLELWQQVLADCTFDDLPLSENALNWLARARLYQRLLPDADWPDFSALALMQNWQHWLWPYMLDCVSWKQLQKLDWLGILKQTLNWQQQQALEQHLPQTIKVPTGSQIPLNYQQDKVVLAVRMQEVYGWQQSPQIASGRLAVSLELLSPAHRPLQTTADLAGFWAGSYKEVQKEMKGRYPKHNWPDDPANAKATRTTKKRM